MVPSVVLLVAVWAFMTLSIVEALVVIGLVSDILIFLAYSGIKRNR
jgi:hypothetical protein